MSGPREALSCGALSWRALSWRALKQSDMPAVTDLARQCLSADGGQPFAADPGFLARWYQAGAETNAGWDGPRLICVSSVRRSPTSGCGQSEAATVVTTGLVHPAWRRRGIGAHAFDWAAREAGNGAVHAETEMLSDGADALYVSKGLSQVFAEDVMQLPEATRLPPIQVPADLSLSQWDQADPARFFAVYQAAFRERPGFPGWPQERWIEWISDDEDFRPGQTLLASFGDDDVGYVVSDAAGWIVQMGVAPSARGRNIGAMLITEAVQRMRFASQTAITLNVNVNNPHAIALYCRLGFTRTGRRGRYEAQYDSQEDAGVE